MALDDGSKTTGREADADLPEYAVEWMSAQRLLAEMENVALVTVGPANAYNSGVANNTSICQAYQSQPTRAALCAEFCGRARASVLAAGRAISYRCHAGLHCFAAPLAVPGEPPTLALIGGRVFLSAREYREFRERAASESGPQLYSNLKFTDAQELERTQQFVVTAALENLAASAEQHLLSEVGCLFETPADISRPVAFAERPAVNVSPSLSEPASERQPEQVSQPSALAPEQLKLFFNGSFEQGCREAMRLFGARFHIRSGVLLMRSGRRLVACAAGGAEHEQLIGLRLDRDAPLFARLRGEVELCDGKPFALALSTQELAALRPDADCTEATAWAFLIGDELSGVLLTLDTALDAAARRELLAVGQAIIVPLELARLRGEVEEREKTFTRWQSFAHLLATQGSAEKTYAAIVEKVAATLSAERVSLLVLNDETRHLVCRAARGLTEDVMDGLPLGEGIASAVLETGDPLVVGDLSEMGWLPERTRGTYRTGSFISFPIQSGGRRLGVLNVTDRFSGHRFGEGDLAWLRHFAPYVIMAIERIDLREKLQCAQKLAITDSLTGLLNRRYLEERFAEEVARAKRYQYPLSFIMLDIDDFKKYNDTFGHQSGDDVLRATAQCIRSSLRNFDVAARYGGEEFILVLPETETSAAADLAERLRNFVKEFFHRKQPDQAVTVSVGIASLSIKLQTKHQIIRAADKALYAAKKRGKNCVVVYNTDLEPGSS
jgi:diguanylate cyclase (GGDEF)-like protein